MATDLKQKIQGAAFQLFKDISYSKTSVSDIAAAAGVGKGTVYLYYKSKEELFSEIVDIRIIEPNRELKNFYLNPSITLEEKLSTFVDKMISSLSEIKQLMFGSFDNVQSKTIREVFLNYSNYVGMFVECFYEVLILHRCITSEQKKIMENRLADFFNLLIGRAILHLFEEDWNNMAPIRDILKRVIRPLLDAIVINTCSNQQ